MSTRSVSASCTQADATRAAAVRSVVPALLAITTPLPLAVQCPAPVLAEAIARLTAALAGTLHEALHARTLLDQHLLEPVPDHCQRDLRTFFVGEPTVTSVLIGLEDEEDDDNGRFSTPRVLAALVPDPGGCPTFGYLDHAAVRDRLGGVHPLLPMLHALATEPGVLHTLPDDAADEAERLERVVWDLGDALRGQGMGRVLAAHLTSQGLTVPLFHVTRGMLGLDPLTRGAP